MTYWTTVYHGFAKEFVSVLVVGAVLLGVDGAVSGANRKIGRSIRSTFHDRADRVHESKRR